MSEKKPMTIKEAIKSLYESNKENFENLDEKITHYKHQIENISNKIDDLNTSVFTLSNHVINMDREFIRLQTSTNDNIMRLNDIENDIEKIEQSINQYISKTLQKKPEIEETDEIFFEGDAKNKKEQKEFRLSNEQKKLKDFIFRDKPATT